jgi:hypothetical protein
VARGGAIGAAGIDGVTGPARQRWFAGR